MSGVNQYEAGQVLGEHYIEVASLLAGNNLAERQAGVHAAATYIEKNLDAIAANPDAAKEIQTMLRQSAEGVPDIGPVLSALEAKLIAEPEAEIEPEEVTGEIRLNNADQESDSAILERADHMVDMLDIYLEDIQRSNRGSTLTAKQKLPGWQFEIRSWPKSVQEDPRVKVVKNKLLGIEDALAKLNLQ